MKCTRGFYRKEYKKIDWVCPWCSEPNMSNAKFNVGSHILKCFGCGQKHEVMVYPIDYR